MTAVGVGALSGNTTASFNSAFGYYALRDNTTGAVNDAFGYYSLNANTTGASNVAMGSRSLQFCTTGTLNNAFGRDSLRDLTTGYQNTALGNQAAHNMTTGHSNTAVGHQSLQTCSTGTHNVTVGPFSLNVLTSGAYNIGLGLNAGADVTTGEKNILIGVNAGRSTSPAGSVTTSDNILCLGDNDIASFFCADTSISSSDSRDKTDVESFNIGLAWVNALRPVTYRWDRRTWYGTDSEPYGTPDGSKKRTKKHIGFLAQEALEVEKANGYGSSNDDSLVVNLTDDGMSYGMKYERLVPILVNAIKELSAKVTALEAA